MKKLTLILMALALVIGLSGIAMAAITGSSHDFTDNLKGKKGNSTGGTTMDEVSVTGWNGRGEICRVCHVPHDHGKDKYVNGLLWNHKVSEATYTMYDSATLTGTQSAQPDGTAKLCLGCHDGSVGIDTFDKYAGGTVFITTYDAGYKVPGFTNDLTGTHPISIAFPAAEEGDGENFTASASATWADGSTVASTLDNGKVQCSTCHDVHSQESVPGTHLLRAAQSVADGGVASGLCLTCHVK